MAHKPGVIGFYSLFRSSSRDGVISDRLSADGTGLACGVCLHLWGSDRVSRVRVGLYGFAKSF